MKNNKPVEEIKIAAAILGSSAEAARIAQGYADAGVALEAIWDEDKSSTETIAKRFGIRAAGSLEEIIDDRRINAVEVCTKIERRAGDAIHVLKAGKAASVRAPVSNSVEEAKRLLIEVTIAADRFRYLDPIYHHAPHALAKKLARNNEIGTINGITIKTAAADVAPFSVDAIEEPLDRIMLAQWYIGRAAEIETIRSASISVSIMRFDKKHCFGNFEAVYSPQLEVPFAERNWDEYIEITGSTGIIWVNGFWGPTADRPPVVMRRFKRVVNFGADIITDPRAAYKRAAAMFAKSIERNEFHGPYIDEAVSDVKLILAAAKSAKQGGRVRIE